MISFGVTLVHAKNTSNNNTNSNKIIGSSSNSSNSTIVITRSSACSTQRSRRGEKVEHDIITSETTPQTAATTTRRRIMDKTNTEKPPPVQQLSSSSSARPESTSRRKRKRPPPPPPPPQQQQQLVDSEEEAEAEAATALSTAATATTTADIVSNSLSFGDQSNEQVPSRKRRKKRKASFKVPETPLGKNYKPRPNDVICQRGHEAKNWQGNKTFRHLIETNLETYRAATTKKEKTTIVSTIIDRIRSTSPPGKFIRKNQNQDLQNEDRDSQWYETGDDFAREKVGQGFRDKLHTEYKSSSKAKISRRKESTKLEQEFEEFIESDPSDDPLLGRLTSTTKKTPSQPSTKIKKKKMEKRFSLSTTPISAPAIPYKRTHASTNVTTATAGAKTTSRRTPDQFATGAAVSLSYDSLPETTTGSGGRRVYPQQQYRQRQQHPQRTSGTFPYPPSFVGGFSNDGRQRILMGSDIPVQFDPRSSPSSFDPSSGETTAFRDRMMMMMTQPPAGHNFNSFSDLSLSSHPPERNVGIYDMDPIQNQRLLGRDRIPAPPMHPQHQQPAGSTLSSSSSAHRRQQPSPKDTTGADRFAFDATGENALGKPTSFTQQFPHLSRYNQTPQQMQVQQQQLLQRQQQVFFDLQQQRNATTTTTTTTQGSNEAPPQVPPSLDISSKSRIQDDEPLPWKEDPES